MISRWASLQMSAHILQNLLLWWKLGATLRGCAFFFQILLFEIDGDLEGPYFFAAPQKYVVRRKNRQGNGFSARIVDKYEFGGKSRLG